MKIDKETDQVSVDHADNRRRHLPSLDVLLKVCTDEVGLWGHLQVKNVLTGLLDELRQDFASGGAEPVDLVALKSRLRSVLEAENTATLKPVFNLTGTVLHTNLGRASLPRQAIDAVVKVAAQPTNLEFDLTTGSRGDRESHIEKLICELTGAEAATAVNNNAAAVLLVLNTLAFEREVPVSRGELVEIGGSFRIPEVMRRANCQLVEVGATNRTHLGDYQSALTPNTALLMKVHTSNYRVEGFTAEVSEQELAGLAREHAIPFVMDLGSGSLVDFAALGLPAESTAAQVIAAGADLVTFSGDKLLGGPQSGLIAGRRDLIARIKKNPLKRALRLDKMTLAALAEVLKLYRNPACLLQELPTLRQLTRNIDSIRLLAEQLQPVLAARLGQKYQVTVEQCFSQIGSGALPVDTLPSCALRISPVDQEDATVRRLAEQLRQLPVPVIGRLHQRSLWLDLRCLERDKAFVENLEHLAL